MKYIIDLDGTLLDTKGGDYAGAKPINERVDRVRELYKEGHTIAIQTARGRHWEDYTLMQLDLFQIPYHAVSVGEKIHGDVYIDDKGINAKEFFV